ncbi:class II aldolase/adducin family protein [Lentisphaerota bacterium ZTH]|nr:class II aldolase/adducin family protein [Lentisphaerota bacterium]WET07604.1 class II aldolase/adducin family protein [Lentisphaerota bacterium ZTH]
MDKTKSLAKDIAYFMRRLYKCGLTTTSGGNISARCGENVLITPSATDKARMKGAQVGMLDMDCEIVGESFKPTIESRMHLEIYKRRADVQAIVHAHPVTAGAFAASGRDIATDYLAEAYVILGDLAYAEYRCQGTEELAEVVGDAAEKSDCIVMRNHGIIALGSNLLQAFDRLEVLENAAKTTLFVEGPLIGHGVRLDEAKREELDRKFRH